MNQVSPIVTTFPCFLCTCYLHTKEIITKNTYIINYLLHDGNYCKKINQINHTTEVSEGGGCVHACMHVDLLCGHRLVQTKEITKKELTKMGKMGWWTWYVDAWTQCADPLADEWKKKKKRKKAYLSDEGWWMRALRVQMRCVLCCVRTCWLADAFPADADECKQKRKKILI